jgi:hypothetical protein
MNIPSPTARYGALVAVALFLASGIVGSIIGRAYGAAPGMTPAWVAPVILIGSLALIVVGVLLLPAAIRAARARA